ncbi:MAG TPA: PD-(D/E)XK nuclease family protein [Vicinamibacterales bacterium]|nr:PD-(D/E)XK nuclease family protein [Vicinamibacterales bacterium]
MITPRITRLLRVPDLRAMHQAIAGCIPPHDPLAARTCAVIVPTTGAAVALGRTLETLCPGGGPGLLVLPDLLTRRDFYRVLHERLPGAPGMLSAFEREVLLRRAARAADLEGASPPFRLRPGLILEILGFYDELRRRGRSVADFERLMTDSLAPSADIDRGAARMLRQTRFLAAAFAGFEQGVEATGRHDEHALRTLLIQREGPPPYRHVVVTVADQAADPFGLWPADFDLLARIRGLERLDVIATENVLAAGFHERIHDLLPGLDEERRGSPGAGPVLAAPQPATGAETRLWHVCRDREEEMADVARWVVRTRNPDRFVVVFQRPLPYLYLARYVFGDAGLPYQAVDSLPLAAEPFAAALDLVFTFAAAEANRASLVALLGSPHWRFAPEPGAAYVTPEAVAAADALLRDWKYFGGWERLAELAAEAPVGVSSAVRDRPGLRSAAPAILAAARAAERIRAIEAAPGASAQIAALRAFIRDHERPPDPVGMGNGPGAMGQGPWAMGDGEWAMGNDWFSAHVRARAAILGALESLECAHAQHDDRPLPFGELAGTIRRWIEGQTFSPQTGHDGLTMLDGPAAAYADADEMRICGLVEQDWPDRGRRSIFYPAALLSQLGWPDERDRHAAGRARFRDLLRLPGLRLSLSTFTLEDDAVVPASPLLEELGSSGLAVEHQPADGMPRIFKHEALSEEPIAAEAVHGPAASWLALRLSRSDGSDSRFHGSCGPRAPSTYAVSHLERYLDCPFKYFAKHVLRLDEERKDEAGLSPQERGQLLHDVFERFFDEWRATGRGRITAANLPQALELFEEVAEARLAPLSESDRAMERTYLLGSAVSSGLAARAFAFEIEHGVDVVERLLEYTLEGEFDFEGPEGTRRLGLRAKADRIDLLADGTIRVIDYKLGRAPKPSRALQLPVYGLCAAQHLEGRHGRQFPVSRAGYVAFREKNAFVPLGGSTSLEEALDEGQQRLLRTVSAVERGEFPPQPDEPFICTRCGYAPVCRKDYVGDE